MENRLVIKAVELIEELQDILNHEDGAGLIPVAEILKGIDAEIKELEASNERIFKRATALDEQVMDFKAGKDGRAAGIDFAIKKMCEYCAAGHEVEFEDLEGGIVTAYHAFDTRGDECGAEKIHIGMMEE